MGAREDKVLRAWQEVFGESPDDLARATHIYGKYGFDKLRTVLATTPDARKKGIDGTAFGAEIADPSRLNSRQKAFYDAAADTGSGPIYLHEIRNWAKYGSTPDHYRASLKGQIVNEVLGNEEKGFQTVTRVTPGAIETMGGKFDLRGFDTGRAVFVPTGTRMSELWVKNEKLSGGKIHDGYDLFVATGEQSDGLLGEVADITGVDEFKEVIDIVPDEVWAAVDLHSLGSATSIIGGAEAKNKALDAVESVGIDAEDYTEFTGYADMAADLVILVASGGSAAPILAAKHAVKTVSRAAMAGNVGFEDIYADLAFDAVNAYFAPGALTQAALAGGRAAVNDGDWADIGVSVVASYAAGKLGADDAFGATGSVAVSLAAALAKNQPKEDMFASAVFQAAAHSATESKFEVPTMDRLKNVDWNPGLTNPDNWRMNRRDVDWSDVGFAALSPGYLLVAEAAAPKRYRTADKSPDKGVTTRSGKRLTNEELGLDIPVTESKRVFRWSKDSEYTVRKRKR